MKFVYMGKNLEVSDELKQHTEKKLSKLERYFQSDVVAQVRLSMERGARNIAEITISVGNVLLRAEEDTNDMYISIDKAVDKLNRQIRRHRTKLEKRLRAGAFEPDAAPEAVDEPEEEASYNIVRVKKFAVKPMNVEDAIAQMELLGHAFFLFQNAQMVVCLYDPHRLYKQRRAAAGLPMDQTGDLGTVFLLDRDNKTPFTHGDDPFLQIRRLFLTAQYTV